MTSKYSYIITRDSAKQGTTRVHFLGGDKNKPAAEIFVSGVKYEDGDALRAFFRGFDPETDTVYWRCPRRGPDRWWTQTHERILRNVGCITGTYVYDFNE